MNFFHFSLSQNKEENLKSEIKKKLEYFNKDILINIDWMLIGEIIKSGNNLAKSKIKEFLGKYGKEFQNNKINNEEIDNKYFKNNNQKEIKNLNDSDFILEINSNSFSSFYKNSVFNNSKDEDNYSKLNIKELSKENNNEFEKKNLLTKIEIGKENNKKEMNEEEENYKNNLKENLENKNENINRIQQSHLKNLDDFIQNCLDKFKFIDPLQTFYDKTGKDKDLIISHKSTIPDLVIWNKTFNKNECFEGANLENNRDFPRYRFYLRLNKDKDSKNKNNKEKDKEKESLEKHNKKITPPTYEEILEYAIIRKREELANKFYDYYTAGGWKDGEGKPVKNWKQKFITWETHNLKKAEIDCPYDFSSLE